MKNYFQTHLQQWTDLRRALKELRMKPFVHFSPTKIVFGEGALSKLPAYIESARCAIIVTGKHSAVQSGLAEKIKTTLSSSSVKNSHFYKVGSNPAIPEVNAVAENARKTEADLIIGVGGGSAMDAAKAAAVLTTNKGDFRSLIGKKRFESAPLPLILIPTTAGTGSEVNQYAIINNEEGKDKLNLNGENTFAKVAILDPELSVSMPEEITVDTGMDALCHAIEGYISRRAVQISDTLALPVFEMIRDALPIAVKDSSNLDARGRMLYASSLAGMVISHTGTTIVHAMGYALTLKHGVSHGRANAALIAHGLRLNYTASPLKIGKIYEVFGGKNNSSGIDAIFDFLHSLGVRTHLKDYGVIKESLPDFKRYVMGRANVKNSPAEISEEEMERFLEEIL